MKKSGKMNNKTCSGHTFSELYNLQINNQEKMLRKGMYGEKYSKDVLPTDNIELASYHIQQLMSEIGEVLDADKRWKNFRNDKYSPNDKLDELADCFIVLMNIVMYSGFTSREVSEAIYNKINVVYKRIMGES